MNLFIALLLSSFGTDKLKDVKDDEINKIQEAIDRIKRFINFLKSKINALRKIFHRKTNENVKEAVNKKHFAIENTGISIFVIICLCYFCINSYFYVL